MSSRLIALGVRNGDSFFLEREGRNVLIDGGENQKDLCRLFKGVTKLRYVNYLVCTHADADHINGLIGYLEDSTLNCSELWLPSYMGYRIEDILERPEESLAEIKAELRKRIFDFLKETEKGGIDFRTFNETILGDRERSDETEEKARGILAERISSDDVNAITKFLAESLSKTDCKYFELWPKAPSKRRPFEVRLQLYSENKYISHLTMRAIYNVENEYIDLFKKMRQLVVAALSRGVRLRFFEFCKYFSCGGEAGFLEPVNSFEVVTRSALKKLSAGLSLLQILALSIQNEQSLVFISPKNECLPAALFCADSDLKFYQPIRWSKGMVSTAPHHGSVSNDHAYWRFVVEGGGLTIIWLRTHHSSVNQLADFLISANGQHVESTYCARFQRISIELIPHNGYWKVVRKTSELY